MTSTSKRFFGLVLIGFLILVARSAVAGESSENDCPLEDKVSGELCKKLLEDDAFGI